MTDELRAKFEAWLIDTEITHEDVSALWVVDGYANGYIGSLWEGFEAAHASRDAEVEALKRDAERYRKLLALLDAAEQVSNEASTIRNIIEDSIGLGSECLNLHLDAMAKESGE